MAKPCLSAGAQLCTAPGAPGAGGPAAATAGVASAAPMDTTTTARRRGNDLCSMVLSPVAEKSATRREAEGTTGRGAACRGAPPGAIQPPVGGMTTSSEPVRGGTSSSSGSSV